MRTLLAGIAIACSLVTLSSCDQLTGLGEVANNLRTFTYSYKKLPAGTRLIDAKRNMEMHLITDDNTEEYIGNKQNNTLYYRLRAVPPATSHQGELMINVRDQDVTVPGATGALIDALPLPTVGDTITLADVHIYITEDVPVEYQNANDPNSYFRLVLNSLDYTNNKASGWFQGIVQCPSGPHAGEIYAITGGAFTMDINNN